jgi:hypothetical protein
MENLSTQESDDIRSPSLEMADQIPAMVRSRPDLTKMAGIRPAVVGSERI